MITIAASELQFYQKKIYRLQMDLIVLQEELVAAKVQSPVDQYKIKYEMLLDKTAEENHLRQSKKNGESLEYQKNIADLNAKWESNLQDKAKEFRDQIQSVNDQKAALKSKLVEAEMKCLRLQREIDSGDSQVLNIKLVGLKKENDRLRAQSNEAYQSCEKQMADLKRNFQMRMQQTKQREKSFYREQIETLEKAVQELGAVLDLEREKNNPERENLIGRLTQQMIDLKAEHEKELQEMASLIESKNREIVGVREELALRQTRYFKEISELNGQLKQLQDRLYESGFQKDRQLEELHRDMSLKRQEGADDMKRELERVAQEFSHERQEWRSVMSRYEQQARELKASSEEEKRRFGEEKGRLKSKINELKIRLQEREESVGRGETDILIKSLREMNNNEGQFTSYENAITFMDRQVNKAIIKLNEKDREINNLLSQLGDLQKETEKEIEYTKEKSRGELRKLYQKVFELEGEMDGLRQELRERERAFRKREKELSQQKQDRLIQIDSLNKIIKEMERDYERLTGHKKNVEENYRSEREVVITSKLYINTEKKKKWTELGQQRDNMEVLYREKEQQLKAEAEVLIDRLKREKEQLGREKQELTAEVESLKQRLNVSASQNKENRYVEFQKKMATLDLEINLTQNLFKTLASATSRQPLHRKTQLQEVSEGQSERISSQRSMQNKLTQMIPSAMESSQMQRVGGAFSFFPSREFAK